MRTPRATHRTGRRLRHIVPLAAALLLVPTAVSAAVPVAGEDPPGARGRRVVVTFAPGTTPADRAAVVRGSGAERLTRGDGLATLSFGGAAAPVALHATAAERARLAADERVRSIVPDVAIRADAVVVDDPEWPAQDGMRRIRADEAWEQTTGDAGVVIAVVDTGVAPSNPDLAGRVLPGHDFVNGDSDPRDDNGHGTAVATIAAAASDTFGIAGVCWRCGVMPLKVLDADGNGFLSDAALGIMWAAEHGADIVNVSLSASATMPALDTALAAAEDAGVLVVGSAGNAGTTTEQWPAADPRVMGIAALDDLDQRAGYSSYGSWVDAAAPGCNPSGWIDNSIVRFCGTSSSAPLVSGAAALLMSASGPSGGEVRAALRDTAVFLGSGLGAGRIDVLAALRAVPTFSDIQGSVHAGNIETLAAAGITEGCDATRYCPLRKVTRGQIATFLDRALVLPDGTHTFTDVPQDHPHATGIGAVAAAGITSGCSATQFCPGAQLTRGQMASLLQRALDLSDGSPRFGDVPADHPHARGIWAIAAAGITAGCEPELFCPGAAVDRAQMASFLVRALDL